MIRVVFLGTAASRPTVSRNVSGLMLNREGALTLFDCGEGTQRQMMRFGTGFAVDDVFFTHMHADHFLGIIGLLRTMGLQGREHGIRLWCPAGTRGILEAAVHLGVDRVGFPVELRELEPGAVLDRDDHEIRAFRTTHGGRSLGYALVEHDRLGRFDPERARQLGVPEGPLFGRLHRGEAVEVEGRTIPPEAVVGPRRRGRKLVYTGDTRPSEIAVRAARSADLLIHDATFTEEDAARARDTGHSTAREAATVAREAEVGRLLLTHISPRYAEDTRVLEREARAVFRKSGVAYDGLEVEVPFPPDPE